VIFREDIFTQKEFYPQKLKCFEKNYTDNFKGQLSAKTFKGTRVTMES
jgi:hypothetical protein